jgi:CTP:molybdopterin cytidylyltransferase MocA
MRWGAIVLGAGKGERIGGPKALLAAPPSGEALALAHARRALAVGCECVVLVVAPSVAATLADVLPDRCMLTRSTASDQAGSLAVGFDAIDPDARGLEALMVAPVDAPPPAPDTIRALLAALRGRTQAATPSYQGRAGHPIVCRPMALEPVRLLGAPLRDVLRALGDARVHVDVDDPDVVVDLDTPDAWRARFGEDPRFSR